MNLLEKSYEEVTGNNFRKDCEGSAWFKRYTRYYFPVMKTLGIDFSDITEKPYSTCKNRGCSGNSDLNPSSACWIHYYVDWVIGTDIAKMNYSYLDRAGDDEISEEIKTIAGYAAKARKYKKHVAALRERNKERNIILRPYLDFYFPMLEKMDMEVRDIPREVPVKKWVDNWLKVHGIRGTRQEMLDNSIIPSAVVWKWESDCEDCIHHSLGEIIIKRGVIKGICKGKRVYATEDGSDEWPDVDTKEVCSHYERQKPLNRGGYEVCDECSECRNSKPSECDVCFRRGGVQEGYGCLSELCTEDNGFKLRNVRMEVNEKCEECGFKEEHIFHRNGGIYKCSIEKCTKEDAYPCFIHENSYIFEKIDGFFSRIHDVMNFTELELWDATYLRFKIMSILEVTSASMNKALRILPCVIHEKHFNKEGGSCSDCPWGTRFGTCNGDLDSAWKRVCGGEWDYVEDTLLPQIKKIVLEKKGEEWKCSCKIFNDRYAYAEDRKCDRFERETLSTIDSLTNILEEKKEEIAACNRKRKELEKKVADLEEDVKKYCEWRDEHRYCMFCGHEIK